MLNYAIITPAHNEELHLQRTVDSVRMQLLKPIRWVIVDDGSSDETNTIARRAAMDMEFVRVFSTHRGGGRSFGNKARAFNAALRELEGVGYDLIGNLDADVSFGNSYFSNLVRAFEADVRLGITGGIVFTRIGARYVTHDRTPDSVAGAVQLFRRACFDDVGGAFPALACGGEDAALEIIAKSKGWKVEKSVGDRVDEHRQTGTGASTPVIACFHLGRRFYSLGYGAGFFAARCLYRVLNEPVLIGSCAQLCGYVAAALRRQPIDLPAAAVHYLRQTQRRKLAHLRLPTARHSGASTD